MSGPRPGFAANEYIGAAPDQVGAAPDYVGAALDRLNHVSHELTSIFSDAGFAPIEPSVLQPADLLFDLYGEEIWDRAFLVEDGGDGRWCLRPDFTAPVARAHLARMAAGDCGAAARYGYFGPVYRRAATSGGGALHHLQAGIEAISAAGGSPAERLAAEVEVFDISRKAVGWLGVRAPQIVTGDVSILLSLLDALPLAPGWRRRLKRHLRRPQRFQALLRSFAAGAAGQSATRLAFLKSLGALAEGEAADAVQELLALSDIPQIGARSAGEAAARFLRLAADARAHPLPREAAELIEAVLAVRAPGPEAHARLHALAAGGGVDLTAPLDRLAARLEAFAARGVDLGRLTFDAGFGRNIDYYDGFVFEISAETGGGEGAAKLGGGGRYDRLFGALGAGGRLAGVGAALRPEALVAAAEAASGPVRGEAAR